MWPNPVMDTIDELGEFFAQAVVIQPVFGKTTGFEILDHDVRIAQQVLQLRLSFVGAKINSYAGFAAVWSSGNRTPKHPRPV